MSLFSLELIMDTLRSKFLSKGFGVTHAVELKELGFEILATSLKVHQQESQYAKGHPRWSMGKPHVKDEQNTHA